MAALTRKQKLKMIMNDFRSFCRNFIKIVDNNGELISFKLNEQQEHFVDNMGKYNVILKPRQIGFTTVQLAYCVWMAQTIPNTHYLIVSYTEKNAKDLFSKFKRMNDNLPREKYPNLFATTKRDNRDELVFDNGSVIRSVTASSHKDLGRGMTLMYILLSEAAFYPDLDNVLNSLEQALMKTDKSKIVLETTANGFNSFKLLYDRASKGRSKYKSFFFPFYSSAYEKQFKYEIDEAVTWYKVNNKGMRLAAKDLTAEQKQLHEAGCSLNMLMWRAYKLQDMDKNIFYQEYPASDYQAFISTGLSVFDQTMIAEFINYTDIPIIVSRLKGEIPDDLIQYVGKGLEIYHLPKRGVKHYMGVDVAAGGGGDYSTITVFDVDGLQVASFYRNDVPPYRFAEIVRQIGLFFNYAYICIERNGFGTSVLERLRKETDQPYLNLFKHKHFDKGKITPRLGWSSNAVTKEKAVVDAKEAFECRIVKINCKDTLRQMQTFTSKVNGKIENKSSAMHDDLVVSFFLAIQAMKQNIYYVEAG